MIKFKQSTLDTSFIAISISDGSDLFLNYSKFEYASPLNIEKVPNRERRLD